MVLVDESSRSLEVSENGVKLDQRQGFNWLVRVQFIGKRQSFQSLSELCQIVVEYWEKETHINYN